MADFSNYELGDNVYELANGLLLRMAEAARYDLGLEPSEVAISGLIGRYGPEKELQKNISLVKEILGPDSTRITADWVDESGALHPVNRSFAHDTRPPEKVDAVVWSGGVANWLLRRTGVTERLDPTKVGSVLLPVGNLQMSPGQHQLVATYARLHGKLPTQADFVETYVTGRLKLADFRYEVIQVEEEKGDKILDALFEAKPELLGQTVLVAANAPNSIQAAGEVRLSAKKRNPEFDRAGDQLFMVSDTIPVARRGESTATHQNPDSALGQIARNALFLHRNRA